MITVGDDFVWIEFSSCSSADAKPNTETKTDNNACEFACSFYY